MLFNKGKWYLQYSGGLSDYTQSDVKDILLTEVVYVWWLGDVYWSKRES